MTPKFSIIAAGELLKLIGTIGKRKVALDNSVQQAAVQCVAQSIVHRNATPAMQLFEVLAGSMRRDALAVYLETFGNLMWDRAEKKLTFFDAKRPTEGDAFEAHMADATVTPWHSLKKESEPKSVYDAMEVIDGGFTRLRKAAKRGAEIQNRDYLEHMEAAHAQYTASLLQAEMDPDLKQALEDRAEAKATPAQLAKLTEHFSRPIGQVRKAA